MVPFEEDVDSFFEDESVLSAVLAAENQHKKQQFSNSTTDGQDYAWKRKEQWDERANSYSYQSHQDGFSNTDGFSEDKRRRTVDDREYSGPTKFVEQEFGASFGHKPEGEYMAALRGSNSEMWLQATREKTPAGRSNRGGISGSVSGIAEGRGGASDTCYKCGLAGHWARDCSKSNATVSFPPQSGGTVSEMSDVSERVCPCGAGACVVLTANTEKNLGRRFYKCPLKRDEGQCTFFEWCDGVGQSTETDRAPTLDIPQIGCKCGGGPCATLTAKTERNNGRAFYKCPLPKDQACGFFQWCDEAGNDSRRPSTAVSSTSFTPGTKREYGNIGSGQTPVGGSCFKCGQGGHWARDYPNEGGGIGLGGGQTYTTRTPEVKKVQTCYKCGNQGHWSSSCPNSGGGGFAGAQKQFNSSGPTPGGSCFKCGNSGHWANRCPVASGDQR